jgi:RNA polymerase sigma-70 factor (ECF subfamily)
MSAAGDRQIKDVMAALDARYRAPLLAYFIRRVGNRSDAEDLTQETFERLVRATNLDTSGEVSGYVFRIAANLLKDRRRSAGYRRSAPFSAFAPELVDRISRELVEDREPERVLLGREGLVEVLKCLGELGDRPRTVFILHRLEGMKQREIAELLGLGVSTVEKYCMMATALLIARFGSGPR